MKICIVYDGFYPLTIGGIERWLRDLAVRVAAAGHDVTYLTRQRWPSGEEPRLPGVHVVGLRCGPRDYSGGRRELFPPLRFGAAVFCHLLRHGRRYEVVHTASFPYFPLLAAEVLRRHFRYRIVVDWHEVWTRAYWRSYAGPVIGTAGWFVQRLCIAVPQTAFAVSRMHAERLSEEGFAGTVRMLRGMYAGPVVPTPPEAVEPVIVFAGRHVREKRVPALVRAFALLRERKTDFRLELFGDGPERKQVERVVAELGLQEHVCVHGIATEQEVAAAIARATCLATASQREGYGQVVVEAAARGTPSVVVAGAENAAVELVNEANGVVAASAEPEELAAALLQVIDGGLPLRASTTRWFAENASSLRLDGSLAEVMAAYGAAGESVTSATGPSSTAGFENTTVT